MSTRVSGPQSPIIASRDELVAYLEAGAKPKSDWRIGTEHEKFGFYRSDHAPVPYDGRARHPRLARRRCSERFGWDAGPRERQHHRAAAARIAQGGVISLEPGGQLELSGAPLETVHETYEELRQHLAR